MPAEAVAQFEAPSHPVLVARVFFDHLRVNPLLTIGREKRVVDKKRVRPGDQRGGPNGVEDLQIDLRDHPDRAAGISGVRSLADHSGHRHGTHGPRSSLDQLPPGISPLTVPHLCPWLAHRPMLSGDYDGQLPPPQALSAGSIVPIIPATALS